MADINTALIKLNQIGTVSETVDAVHLCRAAGWGIVISHRSGETEDICMADFCRHGRRANQDGVDVPKRTHCQVQPTPGDP